jgi:hypothetical protein
VTRQCRLERFVEPGKRDDARTAEAEVGAGALQDTEQPIVVPVRPVHRHLVVAAHVVAHGLPLPTAGELRRRALGDGLEHGEHRHADLVGAREQKLASRDSFRRVVVLVSLEEVDAPWARRGKGRRARLSFHPTKIATEGPAALTAACRRSPPIVVGTSLTPGWQRTVAQWRKSECRTAAWTSNVGLPPPPFSAHAEINMQPTVRRAAELEPFQHASARARAARGCSSGRSGERASGSVPQGSSRLLVVVKTHVPPFIRLAELPLAGRAREPRCSPEAPRFLRRQRAVSARRATFGPAAYIRRYLSLSQDGRVLAVFLYVPISIACDYGLYNNADEGYCAQVLPLKILRLGAAGFLSIALMRSAAAAPATDSVRIHATAEAKLVIVVGIKLATSNTTKEKLIIAERLANAELMGEIEKELAKVSPLVERAAAASCADRSCLPDLATKRGVDQVILLSGAPNEDEGYDLRAEAWYRGSARSSSDRCEFCAGHDLVEVAAKLVRGLVVTEFASQPPLPAPAAASSISRAAQGPAAELVIPAQPPPPAPASLLAPTLIGAAGLALLAAGATLWVLDGRESHECKVPAADSRDCTVYGTARVGQVLTGVGAAGLAVGGLFLYRAFDRPDSTHVSFGPGSVVWSGRF